MAYQGTTSTSPNPPVLAPQPIAGVRSWLYQSTHTSAEAQATGFITDGQSLGMTLGDNVLVFGSTTYSIHSHAVNAVSSTGVSLSTGSAHSS